MPPLLVTHHGGTGVSVVLGMEAVQTALAVFKLLNLVQLIA